MPRAFCSLFKFCFCFVFQTWFHCTSLDFPIQAGFEIMVVLLPQPPKYWGYRHESSLETTAWKLTHPWYQNEMLPWLRSSEIDTLKTLEDIVFLQWGRLWESAPAYLVVFAGNHWLLGQKHHLRLCLLRMAFSADRVIEDVIRECEVQIGE